MSDNRQTELTNETIEQNLDAETIQDNELVADSNENTKEVADNPVEATNNEDVPSMEDFKDQIEQSFHKFNVGDIVKCSVVGVSDTEVIVDLGSYAEGLIKVADYSSIPNFSLKDNVTVGEEIHAKIIKDDDGEGNILLSKKQADFVLAWEKLQEYLDNGDILNVKIAQSVKGGVLTYVEGIRGFIPASQLSVSYVENLDEWVGKEVEAVVITVDENENRLVLSSKQVELDKINKEKQEMLEGLEEGLTLKGVVDNIVPYGAFVKLENNLSGLVHISQLSDKFIKSPNEVVKEGQEVTVRVISVKDGKINLTMKSLEDATKEEVVTSKPSNRPSGRPSNRQRAKSNVQNSKPLDFTSDQEATTSLADLLKNLDIE
ncbi:MAG: S1 RNA-binding domain-containing protein [Clostridiales bacterium]|nr:S1 RNA-binding domain-containing protein [Clostridiales bacterium]